MVAVASDGKRGCRRAPGKRGRGQSSGGWFAAGVARSKRAREGEAGDGRVRCARAGAKRGGDHDGTTRARGHARARGDGE